ncbi:MAG: DVU0524 family FlgM-associated protein [Desulfovibrionaceae bacterium]
MTIRSYHVRNMLLSYDKHLVNARRLARFRRAMLAANGEEEEGAESREAKRNQLVERVAKEIVENLIITGSDAPLVATIKERLEAVFGAALTFTYPPAEEDVHIFKETSAGPAEITGPDKVAILNKLWQVTLDTVNETML